MIILSLFGYLDLIFLYTTHSSKLIDSAPKHPPGANGENERTATSVESSKDRNVPKVRPSASLQVSGRSSWSVLILISSFLHSSS